jgi:DNA-binding NtrC family response regulator
MMTPSTAQFPSRFAAGSSAPSPGLTLVDIDAPPAVGVSAAWRKLITQAEMAAPLLHIATIEGEPGSGKLTLARHIFSRSVLASASFQRRDTREWLATEADPTSLTGFLYLDRVDLLTPPGQNILLGVLKALQDRPAGRAVVVTSSHTSLRQMAAQGVFLPDLAFRLTAIRFAIPPLRQRREDIGPLAQFLLDRLCQRYQQRPVTLGPGALARLIQHAWPGNVRELASILETALLEAANSIIRPTDLPLPDPSATPYGSASPIGVPVTRPADLALDSAIRQHVQYVLDLNHGNKLRAARQLQISRSTLYRILGNDSLLAH